MTVYVFRRLLWMVPSLFIVFTLTFLVVHATPGSPWDEREKPLSEAVKANLNKTASDALTATFGTPSTTGATLGTVVVTAQAR